MNSEEIRVLIPQYLAGQLTPSEKVLFEAQLETDGDLRQELEELRPLWDEMAWLPQATPGAAMRARFYQKLNDMNTGRSRPYRSEFAWWKSGLAGLVRQAAVALVLFGLGLYVGRAYWSKPKPVESASNLQKLDTEVQSLRQTVALSLLDRQSATSRLEGISWSNRVEHPDQDLVGALLNVLNHDANINVRLSALDALGKFATEPQVRSALVGAIPHQDSPLVQIALIDALVHMRDDGAAKEFRKLQADKEANPAVRQRAGLGLQKLSYQ